MTFLRSIRPLAILFLITTVLFIAGRSYLFAWNVDATVLLAGNCILFAVTLFSFYLFARSLHATNPYAITRMIYGSVMVRLVVCLVAVLTYILIERKNVNKAAIIGCLVLYVVYTGMEVAIVTKKSKQQKNV